MIRLPLKPLPFPFKIPTLLELRLLLKQRKAKTVIAAILVVLLVISIRGCMDESIVEQEKMPVPQVTILEITPGLTRSFKATGQVEAEKSVNFLADFTSTVDDIVVKIGDTVEEGQPLLTLKALEVVQDLSTANAVYQNTAQNLTQTRITGQQSVDEAQIALKTAQINLEKLQKEDGAKRRQAEETLNAARLNFGLSEASAKTSLDNSIRKTQTTVQNALTDADDLLEYSPVQEGLTYVKETHLGVRDPAHKLKTMDALNESYKSFSAFRSTYDGSVLLLFEVEQALQMLITVLYNSVSSPDYTQATINSNIDTVTGHIQTIRTLRSELETAQRSLDSTMQKRGTTSQVLIDAEANYETTMAGLEAALRKAELEIERARSALESAIASARASEISALSNVNSARGTLDLAQISRDKLIITAPFSGVVTDIPVRLGREVQPGELVLSMEDATWLKIVTFVSADEVKSITVGDIVEVEDEYEARIASVSPSADPQSKKYKVEMRIGQDTLLPGEFISLTFKTRSNDVDNTRIFLPVTAVHVNAAETYVWLSENDEANDRRVARKQQVALGDLSGKYVEITGGLEEGDTVIVEGGRSITREGQEIDSPSF